MLRLTSLTRLFVDRRFLALLIAVLTTGGTAIAQAVYDCVSEAGSFHSVLEFKTSDNVSGVYARDFNGDGRNDILIAERYGFRMIMATSNGQFAEPVEYENIQLSTTPVLADMNADGVLDLVFSSWYSGSNLVVRTLNADGTLNAAQVFPLLIVGSTTGPVAVGDVNGDGRNDVLFDLGSLDEIAVLLGTPGGSFVEAPRVPVGDHTGQFVLTDLTGDGVLDFAVIANHADETYVFEGSGTGTFTQIGSYAVGTGPSGIVAADFNEDTVPDLFVTSGAPGEVSVLLGLGSGAFATATVVPMSPWQKASAPLVQDFDADGHLDVMVMNGTEKMVAILHGQGDGTFHRIDRTHVGMWPAVTAVADVVGDSAPDLLVSNGLYWDRLLVLEAHAPEQFGPPPSYDAGEEPVQIVVDDLDGDGIQDLVLADNGYGIQFGDVSMRFGLGDGTFGSEVILVPNVPVSDVATEDLDGDGVPDLVLALGPIRKVTVQLGVGDGTFLAPTDIATTWDPQEIDLADFDGDGLIDIAMRNTSSGNGPTRLRVSYGLGGGAFGLPMTVQGLVRSNRVAAGDLNADGLDDLLVYDANSGATYSVLSLASGGFGTPQPATSLPSFLDFQLVDIDANGTLDVIYGRHVPPAVIIDYGVGDGTFIAGPTLLYDNIPTAVRAADMNLDGKLDIVTGQEDLSALAVRLGRGNGEFFEPHYTPTLYWPNLIELADLNADGFLDVVFNNYNYNVVSALLGTRGVDEDDYAPNQDCLSAAPLVAGNYTNFGAFQRNGGDHFLIDVPAWSILDVQLQHVPTLGDLDIFLYDGASAGSTCGDQLSDLARSAGNGALESITWINNSSSPMQYILHVDVFNVPGMPDCNSYDLDIDVVQIEIGNQLCAGDGSTAACPCGNESTSFDEGCLNSTGVGASLSGTGSNAVADDALVLTIAGARGDQPALLIQGSTQIALPFKDGILCMGNPTERLEILQLDPAGSAANTTSIATTGAIPGPGALRFYQSWYRDPQVSPCGTGSNFSSALRVIWQ